MKPVNVYCKTLTTKLNTGMDIKNITPDLSQLVKASTILNGGLMATVVGSTGSLTTIEYEPGVVEDLKRAINRIAPPDDVYAHEEAWHDGNGHSHVQAALLGPSISLPVRNGELVLGTWQQVVLINHDNKSRNRNVEVTIIGTSIVQGLTH